VAARSEHGLTGKLAAFVFGWEREREERKKEVKEMLVHRGMSFSCFLHLKFNKKYRGRRTKYEKYYRFAKIRLKQEICIRL